jgi:hypothetical protein
MYQYRNRLLTTTGVVGLGEDGGSAEQFHHCGSGQTKYRRATAQQGEGRHHRTPHHEGQYQVSRGQCIKNAGHFVTVLQRQAYI